MLYADLTTGRSSSEGDTPPLHSLARPWRARRQDLPRAFHPANKKIPPVQQRTPRPGPLQCGGGANRHLCGAGQHDAEDGVGGQLGRLRLPGEDEDQETADGADGGELWVSWPSHPLGSCRHRAKVEMLLVQPS